MYYNLTFFPITGLNEVFGDEIAHHFGGISVQMKIFFYLHNFALTLLSGRDGQWMAWLECKNVIVISKWINFTSSEQVKSTQLPFNSDATLAKDSPLESF